ncbi:MAG: type II restriction endonuclease [Spirochaetes bacterium]|nr:type II restriction endonuclease [Spirochaetota bacterium]
MDKTKKTRRHRENKDPHCENYIEKLKNEFLEFAKAIQNLEKHLGNMRKARGGKSFEKIILILLRMIEITCEIPKGEYRNRLKRIDIVIPSSQQAINYPDRSVFLTCKRTLRERWKQEVPQVGPN